MSALDIKIQHDGTGMVVKGKAGDPLAYIVGNDDTNQVIILTKWGDVSRVSMDMLKSALSVLVGSNENNE